MKKLFRFTAVAVVAFALCMALPACDLIDRGDDDDSEQNGGDNNGDDDDNAGGGDAIVHEPWWDFGGVWEAYEWYADENEYELEDYEVELMKEQTCFIRIEPTINYGTREEFDYKYFVAGDFEAKLLWRLVYANGPASDNRETRAGGYELEFEYSSGWFMIPMEERYFEDRGDFYKIKRGEWLTVNVLYPMQDGTEGLGHVWKMQFDTEDTDSATFRFDEYHIVRMRRISKY